MAVMLVTRPARSGVASAAMSGFGAAAASGGAWNTLQVVTNKVLTVLSTIVLARLLTEEDYGLGNTALGVVAYVVVLSPLSIGDLLISRPALFAQRAAAASRVGLAVAAMSMAVILLLAWPMEHWRAAPGLGVAIAVAALRPMGEALVAPPLSRMRLALDYRRIAIIDGAVQALATLSGILLAWLGGGAIALVAPQVGSMLVRAIAYRRCESGTPGLLPPQPGQGRALVREFAPLALGQYVHNAVLVTEVLVLGLMASEVQAGIFAFAFMLASQLNVVLSFQVGVVMQPIFAHLNEDRERQRVAFLRAVRAMAALCIPAMLVQAAAGAPAFRLLFEPRWLESLPSFWWLSLGAAFFFACNPVISLLKAQLRSRAFLAWQGIHLLLSIVGCILIAPSGGATGIAMFSALAWSVSATCAVLLELGWSMRALARAVGIFIVPMIASSPAALALWWLGQPAPADATWDPWRDILLLVLGAPSAFVLSVMLTAKLMPSARTDLARMISGVFRRFARPPHAA